MPPFWGKPIVGRDHVSRLLVSIGRQLREVHGSLRPTEINGQPGALALGPDGSLISVLAIDIADGQVQTFRSIISRPKLGHLGPLADVPALLEMRRANSAGHDPED